MNLVSYTILLTEELPLFLLAAVPLWFVSGADTIASLYVAAFLSATVLAPGMLLWQRVRVTKKHQDKREIVIGRVRGQGMSALFATLEWAVVVSILLLLHGSWLGFLVVASMGFILGFLGFNLRFPNLHFIVRGYRVFTVSPPLDNNPVTGTRSLMLITRRHKMQRGARLIAYRLTNDVYLEEEQ